MPRWIAGLGAMLAVLWLAGCAATGHNFDPGRLSRLTPGQTTLEEAARELGAPPDTIYGQRDGGVLALWQFKITFVTDGFYSRKEALLQFGPDGRLMRLVDSTNILLEPWERRKLLGPEPPWPAEPAAPQAAPQAAPVAIPVPAAPVQ